VHLLLLYFLFVALSLEHVLFFCVCVFFCFLFFVFCVFASRRVALASSSRAVVVRGLSPLLQCDAALPEVCENDLGQFEVVAALYRLAAIESFRQYHMLVLFL
jgi:hypothetical protein